jgi:hypothetical protein
MDFREDLKIGLQKQYEKLPDGLSKDGSWLTTGRRTQIIIIKDFIEKYEKLEQLQTEYKDRLGNTFQEKNNNIKLVFFSTSGVEDYPELDERVSKFNEFLKQLKIKAVCGTYKDEIIFEIDKWSYLVR